MKKKAPKKLKQKTYKGTLPKNLKEISEKLQSQANDIAANVYVSQLKPEVEKLDKAFPEMPPVPKVEEIAKKIFGEPVHTNQKDIEFLDEINNRPLGYTMKKDYSTVLDCIAAIAMASGFLSLGYAMGMMR